MENIRERNEAVLFADMDFRTPLSAVPKPPKKQLSRALNPLKWFVIIALSGIFTGGISTLIWYAYMQGYDEASADHAPEIKPEDSPLKVKPEVADGFIVPHQNRHVYEVMKGGKVNDQVEHLLPMPEAPLVREVEENSTPTEPLQAEAVSVEEAVEALPESSTEPVTMEEPTVAEVKVAPPVAQVKKPELVKAEIVKTEVKKPPVSNVKVRLQFGTLRTVTAADREVARLKSQFRGVLKSHAVTAQRFQKGDETLFRIQSDVMDLNEAETLQKQLQEQKLTAVILR